MDLSDFGLEDGDLIRFRLPNARWKEGLVRGLNEDGSLRVFPFNSGERALAPERYEIQRPIRGPRGGQDWTAIDDPAST